MKESVFRAYDIRGIYPLELDEEVAFKVGAAFGSYKHGKIVVGCDSRLSSPSLKKAVINGLLSTGADVIDIGLTTTPILSFSVRQLGCNGGVMVSASHNPKEYNGFKLYEENGIPIGMGYGLEKVKSIFEEEKFRKGKGSVKKKNVFSLYHRFVLSQVRIEKPVNIRVVVDCGNASPGAFYPRILRNVCAKVYELYCEPDGNFPNHEPNPSREENLKDLKKVVIETKANMGFAYDGDGDRLVVVNEKGKVVSPSVIFSILIKSVLKKHPGSKVVHTVADSRAIEEIVKSNGGVPIECRVGHTFISRKMVESGAMLAGEISGHYYFRETGGCDDALFATLKLIEYLSESGKGLLFHEKAYPRYYGNISGKSRYEIKESEKFSFVEKLKEEFRKRGYTIDTTDGVKVVLKDAWLLVRASETEPVVAILYEAKTKRALKEVEELFKEVKESIPR